MVLAGWSGGGSLSVFYQQQAQNPTVTASPSGDGPDLTKLGLIPADGIMLLAAHVSRHGTMTEWMDASILDESDPSKRDPELDLYNPDNPNQPPYTAEFLERYREAQIARNRRITKWVKEKLAELKAAGRPDDEFAFVVHGTMADPRWLDPTVDPERTRPADLLPGRSSGGEQRARSAWPGSARCAAGCPSGATTTPTATRSQCGPDIAVPALVIGNLADDACTPSHTRRLFEAIGHPDKEMHEIPGANHYYSGPGPARHAAPGRRHLHGLAAPARVLAMTVTGPLDGIRVIEVGTLISGPFAGRLLGDMGAEVIKIEPPGAPDPLRTWGQAELDGHHFFWTVHARNKKAVTLNLREAAGRELFLDLVEKLRHHRGELPARHAGEVGPRLRRAARTQSRASSWSGCPATARPDPRRTRPATPRSPRRPAGCGT